MIVLERMRNENGDDDDSWLEAAREESGMSPESVHFAEWLDSHDPLSSLRAQFHIPQTLQDPQPVAYLLGNSLGLQPRSVRKLILEELEVWAERAEEGHFDHPHDRPWLTVDEECARLLLPLVGACDGEVAVMGSLTSNLHLLLCAFYHPLAQGGKYKILLEQKAFPSDHYLVESQLRLHGIDPDKGMALIKARPGEIILRTKDILQYIKEQGSSLALILLSGVQYYSGQLFDIQAITKAAHEVGAVVGFDLAHAVGNVPLKLHEWSVDFAAWCSYKYLNAGPGAIGGLFVHSLHDHNPSLTTLRGWWGHRVSTRFHMSNQFEAIEGAKGFQLSNPDVLSMTSLLGSLRVFAQTDMMAVRKKSRRLVRYLRWLLSPLLQTDLIRIITPMDPAASGAQLSLLLLPGHTAAPKVSKVVAQCKAKGVVLDKREPDMLRVAPVALYNTFVDVHRAASVLVQIIGKDRV